MVSASGPLDMPKDSATRSTATWPRSSMNAEIKSTPAPPPAPTAWPAARGCGCFDTNPPVRVSAIVRSTARLPGHNVSHQRSWHGPPPCRRPSDYWRLAPWPRHSGCRPAGRRPFRSDLPGRHRGLINPESGPGLLVLRNTAASTRPTPVGGAGAGAGHSGGPSSAGVLG